MSVVLCAIYVRVSTEEQATHGYSLQSQREACEKKARELAGDAELRTVVFEDAMSGDHLERPAMDELREFVREHQPQYMICLDPDRFSRKLVNQLIITDEIERAGTRLVFVQHDYQKTPEGQLFYSMRGAIAQYEKAKILERMRRGARAKLKSGKLAYHAVAYGYRYNKDEDTLEIIEDEAKWVRHIFRWYLVDDIGPYLIADKLNELGVPTKRQGGKWFPSTVNSILGRRTYIGEMICNRWDWSGATAIWQLPKDRRPIFKPEERDPEEWITVPVPKIIDEETYEAAQRKRQSLRRRTNRRSALLLSGRLRCGLCGDPAYYTAAKDGVHNMMCSNRVSRRAESRRERPNCTLPYVRKTLIEPQVIAEVKSWLKDPKALAERIRRQREEVAATVAPEIDLPGQIETLTRQLEDRRKAQANTLVMMHRGVLDAEVAAEALAETKAQIDAISDKLAELEARYKLAKRSSDLDRFEQKLVSVQRLIGQDMRRIDDLWEKLSPKEERKLVRLLVKEVILYPGRRCEVIPDTSPFE